MYSAKSYELLKKEYNYLLPVLRNKLLEQNNNYYFVGTADQLTDMLSRLAGLYNYYNEISSTVIYKCFKEGSICLFRNELKSIDN